MSPTLRVGVVLDATSLHAWQKLIVDRIRDSDFAELALVIVRAPGDGAARNGAVRASGWWSGLLLDVISSRLERSMECEHDAFAPCEAEEFVGLIPVPLKTVYGPGGEALYDDNDVELIRAARLDVLVELGCAPRSARLESGARYGVWCVDGARYRRRDGAPPGFWEVCRGEPVMRIALTAGGEGGEETTLASCTSATHPHSVKLTRSNAYWNAASLVPRKLAQLQARGAGALTQEATDCVGELAVLGHPSLAWMTLYLVRNLHRRAWGRYQRAVSVEQWTLLFHFAESLSLRVSDFQTIVPPLDRYWADPHIVHRDNKHYVFIEEYLLSSEKGHIAVLTLDRDGVREGPTTVLERPYHLSYPFVFEHEGITYMVPESMQNRTVELYRCVDFPHNWVFVRNLLENVRAVDSTLVQHDGTWWLIASMVENSGGSASEELFVFYTDSLLTGTWVPHVGNPVVSDVRRARPAGSILRRNGKLYRPAQDCAVRYGYAIRINEIGLLSRAHYAEKEVARIEPDWDERVLATHTIAHAAGLTVVDALLRRPKLGQHP